MLLARPDVDHVVPVLDGTELRAALAIEKPDASITPADQRLMQDVADGAGLLLRSVRADAELPSACARPTSWPRELQRVAAAAGPGPGGGATAADRRAVRTPRPERLGRAARALVDGARDGLDAAAASRTPRWTRSGGPASRSTSCSTGSG